MFKRVSFISNEAKRFTIIWFLVIIDEIKMAQLVQFFFIMKQHRVCVRRIKGLMAQPLCYHRGKTTCI